MKKGKKLFAVLLSSSLLFSSITLLGCPTPSEPEDTKNQPAKNEDGSITEKETIKNEDGTTTEKETTKKEDGSEVVKESTEQKDGTVVEKEVQKNKDGDVTNSVETVKDKDGTVKEQTIIQKVGEEEVKTEIKKDDNGETSTVSSFVTAIPDVNGIKFTITKPEGYTWEKDDRSKIFDVNSDMYWIMNSSDLANPEFSFVYQLVEPGKTYEFNFRSVAKATDGSIKTVYEKIIVTAKGGIGAPDTVADIKRWKALKPIAKFNDRSGKFFMGFETDINSLTDFIVNKELVDLESIHMGFGLNLGDKEWKHTTWYAGSGTESRIESDSFKVPDIDYRDWLEVVEAGKKVGIPAMWSADNAIQRLPEFDNQYWTGYDYSFKLKSDPTVEYKVPDIQSEIFIYKPLSVEEGSVSGEVKWNDKEGANKITVTKPISSEEEVMAVVKEAVAEYMAFFEQFAGTPEPTAARSATNAKDATAEITKVIEDIMKLSNDKDFIAAIQKIGNGEAPEKDINIAEKVDVADLKASAAVETFYNVEKSIYEQNKNNTAPFPSLKDFEDSLIPSLSQIVPLVEDNLTLKKLYADVKADYSAKEHNISSEGHVSAAIEVQDINSGIKNVIKALTQTEVSVNLPVKYVALGANLNYAAEGKVEDIAKAMQSGEALMNYGPNLAMNADVVLKMNVQTATGAGGYITLKVSSKLGADIYTLINDLEMNVKDINGVMDKLSNYVSINLSVSDGTKDTFTKDYSLKDIWDMIPKDSIGGGDNPVTPSGVTIWSGSVELPNDWERAGELAYTIPAENFGGIEVGGHIQVNFTGDIAQLKLGNWNGGIPGLASIVDEWGNMYEPFSFTLTEEDVSLLKSHGMLLFGNNVTFTEVNYIFSR